MDDVTTLDNVSLSTPRASTLSNKVALKKKSLLEALRRNKGIVSHACQQTGIPRRTFYQYLNDDPDFHAEVLDAQEIALDHVEGKLHELIDGVTVVGENGVYQQPPNVTATIFYLKTKGKKRGYVERQEVEANVNVRPIAGTDAAILFLREAVQQVDAGEARRLLAEWNEEGVTDAAKKIAIETVLEGGVYEAER